jgi:hypothetical protein
VSQSELQWKQHPRLTTIDVCENGDLRRRDTGRALSRRLDSWGYVRTHVPMPDKTFKTQSAHRLVAETFLGELGDKQVNHKNGNKQDNRVANLEICTMQQNAWHSAHVLGNNLGERHPRARLTDVQVAEIRRLRDLGVWAKDIAKMYGVHWAYVYRLHYRLNRTKTIHLPVGGVA